MNRLEKLTEINQKAFDISSSLKLLGNLTWPGDTESQFLTSYNKGNPKFPKLEYKQVRYEEEKAALEGLKNSFTAEDPLEVFTLKTIESFLSAIELNRSIGTDRFTELSIEIFGAPGDLLPGSQHNIIYSAEQLVNLALDFTPPLGKEPDQDVNATDIKRYMERKIASAFSGAGPEVLLTEGLAAKATSTPRIIKIKSEAKFSYYDFKQLFYHEVMTHSLTAINGERQPILKCLGRGALRTLKTQEGLATFSEVITGAMDINRLKRLALRILAIDYALQGANFVDVFEFFLSKGQSQAESYSATVRIFRGGYPDKNIIFTKDCIYLEGLINVHTLFRWAMKHNRLNVCHLLFSGRLCIEDLFELEPAYDSKVIEHPVWLPAWFTKTEGLAGSLSFSLLANLVRIDVANENFFKRRTDD